MSFLPRQETTFQFSCTGSETMQRYSGEFTVKLLLTNGEILKVGRLTDQFTGSSPTFLYTNFARALAELHVRIVEAPKFWKDSMSGLELADQNVILELDTKIAEKIVEYKTSVKAAAEQSEKNAKKDEPREESK
jgi:hypothetical protein